MSLSNWSKNKKLENELACLQQALDSIRQFVDDAELAMSDINQLLPEVIQEGIKKGREDDL